jgi:hypothetical protein
LIASHNESTSVKPARHPRLIPSGFGETVRAKQRGIKLAAPTDNRLQARNDLAWAIAAGGIGIVGFAALLLFTWYFAATLFLIFAGVLLGVALNAFTTLLSRVVSLPHWLRLTIVCLALAGLLSGVIFLGGATIAQQATALSDTIKGQLSSAKDFLERNGIDTSYLNLGNPGPKPGASSTPGTPSAVARKFLYRVVSRADLRGTAGCLSKGIVVPDAGAVSRPCNRHRRSHR